MMERAPFDRTYSHIRCGGPCSITAPLPGETVQRPRAFPDLLF